MGKHTIGWAGVYIKPTVHQHPKNRVQKHYYTMMLETSRRAAAMINSPVTTARRAAGQRVQPSVIISDMVVQINS